MAHFYASVPVSHDTWQCDSEPACTIPGTWNWNTSVLFLQRHVEMSSVKRVYYTISYNFWHLWLADVQQKLPFCYDFFMVPIIQTPIWMCHTCQMDYYGIRWNNHKQVNKYSCKNNILASAKKNLTLIDFTWMIKKQKCCIKNFA